ncbi:helix-turn-helix domain-containing protein [Photobacterium sp. DNB23_23_1]
MKWITTARKWYRLQFKQHNLVCLERSLKATAENVNRMDRSFTAYEFQSNDFEHPYHFHHETELVFITKGSGIVLIGNTATSFEVGDIFFIGSDIPHRFHSETKTSPPPLSSYILQFNPSCFGSLFTKTPELMRIARMISHTRHGLVIRKAPKQLFLDMESLINSSGVNSIIQLLKLLAEVDKSTQLEFISAQLNSDIEIQTTTKIHASVEWINKNFHREINLEELALRTNMNKNAFCRAFKSQTGNSPMNFINNIRVEAASTLLLESHQGIADIGFTVGFPTVSSFNRNFKQLKGVSPGMYRKMTSVFTAN